ncbi:MAG: VWA domain-containing protein [Treponema sp.]|jgi:Ca-activated chloride channel family protein|nr:VWA domain-containing protein [Treponema sp.]
MNIGFERPLLIPLGFIIIALLIFLSRFLKDALTLDIPLGPPGGSPFKPPFNLDVLSRILTTLEFLGVFLLIGAAAGPHLLSQEAVWLSRGADILFVLDISPSMAGLDMDGRSRFDAARKLILDFAASRPSDALGLVALGSDAALLTPPTVDRRAFLTRLESLRIGELGDGTALGLGLATAALHLRNSTASRRAAVLITDGENNAGAVHPESAAGVLADLGISLWVIGVGSSGEVAIDYVDPLTKIRRTGSFESRFDSGGLKAIARKAGGVYIAASSGAAFAGAFGRIDQEEIIVRRQGAVTHRRPIHVPLIIIALFLLCVPRFIRRGILGALL